MRQKTLFLLYLFILYVALVLCRSEKEREKARAFSCVHGDLHLTTPLFILFQETGNSRAGNGLPRRCSKKIKKMSLVLEDRGRMFTAANGIR